MTMEQCKCCGLTNGGAVEGNPRMDFYVESLIKSASLARHEKVLLDIAKDMIENISTGITTSSRALAGEDEYPNECESDLRLAYPEDALWNVTNAAKCLNSIKESLEKHISDTKVEEDNQ